MQGPLMCRLFKVLKSLMNTDRKTTWQWTAFTYGRCWISFQRLVLPRKEAWECTVCEEQEGPFVSDWHVSSAGIHIILCRNGGPLHFSLKAFVINFKNQELISYCDEASIVTEVFKPTNQLTNSVEYILTFFIEGNVLFFFFASAGVVVQVRGRVKFFVKSQVFTVRSC
jgi:hypothetical protein